MHRDHQRGSNSPITPDRSDSTVQAADVIEDVLASLAGSKPEQSRLAPIEAARDRRLRAAMQAAKDALRAGSDPLKAAEAAYRDNT
jgi:hypothetical protein